MMTMMLGLLGVHVVFYITQDGRVRSDAKVAVSAKKKGLLQLAAATCHMPLRVSTVAAMK